MTTHTRLRLGAAALVLLLIALLSGSHLCGVALNKEASDPGMRPIGSGAIACTEFWFNRYQTLLGAAAALAAAAVAWIGVKRQIAKADEQIAVASRQGAIALLPILDQRSENALKIHRAAAALWGSSLEMGKAAKNAFDKSEQLHRAYITNDAAGRMVDVFGASVKDYKFAIDVFEGCFSKFVEEQTRALAGPNFRRATGEITVGAIDVLDAHRAAFKRLNRCTGNAFRDNKELEDSFAAIGAFDFTLLQMPDNAYAFPARIIESELMIMQQVRDQVFEQSRL